MSQRQRRELLPPHLHPLANGIREGQPGLSELHRIDGARALEGDELSRLDDEAVLALRLQRLCDLLRQIALDVIEEQAGLLLAQAGGVGADQT